MCVGMGRRLKASNGKDKKSPNGDVVARNVNQPQDGWTPDAAVDLLRQGYTIEHTAMLTGFDERWLAAQPVPNVSYKKRVTRRLK